MPADDQQRYTPPNLLLHLDNILDVVRRPQFGLVLDFDGTISEISSTPDGAVIYPACAEGIENLKGRISLISILSGRAASDISQKVGIDGVVYVGNHGAEYMADGRLEIAPGVEEYRSTLIKVFDHLKRNVVGDGFVWQDKVHSASVHYRLAPDTTEAERVLSAALASSPESELLEVFWGKLVLELRPPIGVNKGFAMHKLAADNALESVIFIGDDITDLDAIAAIDEMDADGRLRGLGIAVVQDDSPSSLLKGAKYSLRGVPEVAELMRWLGTVIS